MERGKLASEVEKRNSPVCEWMFSLSRVCRLWHPKGRCGRVPGRGERPGSCPNCLMADEGTDLSQESVPMKVIILLLAVVCVVCVATGLAAAEPVLPWYVPMGEQLPGGFDHIQTLIALPNSFADPAIDTFWAYEAPDDIDALAAQWSETYRNPIWAAANGPSLGSYALIFDLYLPIQPPVGTIIHFQAYLDTTRVDNADLRYDGPTHDDWTVLDGTWNVRKRLDQPQWIPGDTDLDDDVDWADYQHLEAGYGSGTTWFEGNFDGDTDVDWADYQKLEEHFGETQYNPEPATLTLVALGAVSLVLRKRNRK